MKTIHYTFPYGNAFMFRNARLTTNPRNQVLLSMAYLNMIWLRPNFIAKKEWEQKDKTKGYCQRTPVGNTSRTGM